MVENDNTGADGSPDGIGDVQATTNCELGNILTVPNDLGKDRLKILGDTSEALIHRALKGVGIEPQHAANIYGLEH